MGKKQLKFKRKRYGYGWVPTSPLGWIVVLVYLILVVLGAFWFLADVPDNTFNSKVLYYLAFVFIGAGILIYISASLGPKPKWRWGKKDSDNPEEDF